MKSGTLWYSGTGPVGEIGSAHANLGWNSASAAAAAVVVGVAGLVEGQGVVHIVASAAAVVGLA